MRRRTRLHDVRIDDCLYSYFGNEIWDSGEELTKDWNSNKELIDTLHATMYIPFYCTYIKSLKCTFHSLSPIYLYYS